MSQIAVLRIEVLVLVDDHAGFTEITGKHGFSTLITVHYDSCEVF